MAEPGIVVARCEACGEPLVGDDPACPSCPACVEVTPEVHCDMVSSEIGLVTDLPPEECATGPLWVRISAATVYAVIGLLCALGGLAFFMEEHIVLSDVVFGSMAIGLSVIAVFGVKESLFPSDWRPE